MRTPHPMLHCQLQHTHYYRPAKHMSFKVALPLLAAAVVVALARADNSCNFMLNWAESTVAEPLPWGSFEVQGDDYGQGAGYVCSCNLTGVDSLGGLYRQSDDKWLCTVVTSGRDAHSCEPGSGMLVLADFAGLEWVNHTAGQNLPENLVLAPKRIGAHGRSNSFVCGLVKNSIVPEKLMVGQAYGDYCAAFKWVPPGFSGFVTKSEMLLTC